MVAGGIEVLPPVDTNMAKIMQNGWFRVGKEKNSRKQQNMRGKTYDWKQSFVAGLQRNQVE